METGMFVENQVVIGCSGAQTVLCCGLSAASLKDTRGLKGNLGRGGVPLGVYGAARRWSNVTIQLWFISVSITANPSSPPRLHDKHAPRHRPRHTLPHSTQTTLTTRVPITFHIPTQNNDIAHPALLAHLRLCPLYYPSCHVRICLLLPANDCVERHAPRNSRNQACAQHSQERGTAVPPRAPRCTSSRRRSAFRRDGGVSSLFAAEAVAQRRRLGAGGAAIRRCGCGIPGAGAVEVHDANADALVEGEMQRQADGESTVWSAGEWDEEAVRHAG